jgi:hypothetical protein
MAPQFAEPERPGGGIIARRSIVLLFVLLEAQRDQGLNPRGAAGGNVAGEGEGCLKPANFSDFR